MIHAAAGIVAALKGAALSNIQSVGTLGTGGASGTATQEINLTTTTNNVAVGDVIVVAISNANQSGHTTDGDFHEVIHVRDSVGNPYVRIGEFTNGEGGTAAGATAGLWVATATAPLPIGSVITATYRAATLDRVMSAWMFTANRPLRAAVGATNPVVNATDASNDFGSLALVGFPVHQRLWFRAMSKEANDTTQITPTSGFTAITADRSRNNASAQLVRGEFIVSASTGETSNPSLAVGGDTASVFAALQEMPNIPLPPTFANAGVPSASTSAITPALPDGLLVNDILVLFLETANETIAIADAAGGTWTEITAQAGIGTPGGTSATRLAMYWSRYNGTQTAPTTTDSGDHNLGVICAFRGCRASGSPIDVTNTISTDAGPNTLTIPGLTTTGSSRLVVAAVADDRDDATTTDRYSNWANSGLVMVQGFTVAATNLNNGGGLGVATGVKDGAGATGSWSVDQMPTITQNALCSFALAGP